MNKIWLYALSALLFVGVANADHGVRITKSDCRPSRQVIVSGPRGQINVGWGHGERRIEVIRHRHFCHCFHCEHRVRYYRNCR